MEKKVSASTYYIRECSNPTCQLRFPAPKDSGIGIQCPKCKSVTLITDQILLNQDKSVFHTKVANPPLLEVVLDNVRSTFNVGAIFRTADAAGIAKIHLCGITPSPTNIKVHKTALGAEKTVNFEVHNNTAHLINSLKNEGKRIWALEETTISSSIYSFHLQKEDLPTVLILGNEIIGVDPKVLSLCDSQLHIPMLGLKGSLNVAIAFGIAVYNLLEFEG